ncbi:MAG: hypothetical protein JO108_35115, partial [Acidobacteriaceae bacterium]|nr:hypothetical protein [Acidobacteriaceae bacterium]
RRRFRRFVPGQPSIDIQIIEVEPTYEDYQYRAPMKFGASVVTRVTIQNIRCKVRGRNGKGAEGFDQTPMANYTARAAIRLWDRITCTTISGITWVPSSAAKGSTATYFRTQSRNCHCITWSVPSTRSHHPTSNTALMTAFRRLCLSGFNGITHIKIKLNADNHEWDLNRVIRVHQATAPTERERKVSDYVYSLDFNGKCPNVGYLVDFLGELKSKSPEAFRRIQYVEQPTARNLKANPQNDMHEASKLVPVVIDESLTGEDTFLQALAMGYSGAALKVCKGQSQSLLLAAPGQKKKVFLCVQDLTCPGESLLQSVSLAAHVPTKAIEANARQYVPAANKGWRDRYPGVFKVRDGLVHTAGLDGPGLGALPVKNSYV